MKWNDEFTPNGQTCYISETGYEYTYSHFIELAEGNEAYAKAVFDLVDWQSPYTIHDENMEEYGSIDNYLNGKI